MSRRAGRCLFFAPTNLENHLLGGRLRLALLRYNVVQGAHSVACFASTEFGANEAEAREMTRSAQRQAGTSVLQTLERGLQILQMLAKEELGPSELSRVLGLHRTTVHRLLRALVRSGFVQRVGDDGHYRANFGYLVELAGGLIANREQNWLVHAKSYLEDLRNQTGLSASLCMPSGTEMVYVMQILGREGLAVHNPAGTRRPLHCSAVGKAYLGALPEPEMDRMLHGMTLTPRTPRTIVAPIALRRQLLDSRVRGYYVDEGEFDPHMRCVAAPVLDPLGHPIGAIGVAGVEDDPALTKLDEVGALIAEKAQSISHNLGYETGRVIKRSLRAGGFRRRSSGVPARRSLRRMSGR